MKLLVIGAILTVAISSALARSWDPRDAVADARRDFAAGKIRFCYIGGLTPYAPGIPEQLRERIRHYPAVWVGPKDCTTVSKDPEAEKQYASRYNAEMWRYLSMKRPISSNQSLQPTADRRENFLMNSQTSNSVAQLALVSGG
jgi:hypothetical protein